MSILTSVTLNTPTKEQLLASTTLRIKNLAAKSFQELAKIQKDGIDLVWNNKMFSPQEIFDAVGEEAVKLLDFHSGLTQYLVTVSAIDGVKYVPAQPTHAFSVVDGKVVVSTEPYTP